MAIRLAIAGAQGRMGTVLCDLVLAAEDLELTGRIVLPGVAALPVGQDQRPGLQTLDQLDPKQVDVLIDFTALEAVPAHAAWCAENRVAWVLGTTGLGASHLQLVGQAAQHTAVFQATNFSIGVALLADLAARAARVLGLEADVEIVETHHRLKRDAPSGTALTLAQAIASARGQDLQQVRSDGRSGLVGERPRGEIGIHAVRTADIVGEHEVVLGWPAERLVLKHDARDRKVFALGALRAARWLVAPNRLAGHGLFGMADLLGS